MGTHKAVQCQDFGLIQPGPFHSQIVDDFEVKYVGKEHAMHMITILKLLEKRQHCSGHHPLLLVNIPVPSWTSVGIAATAKVL